VGGEWHGCGPCPDLGLEGVTGGRRRPSSPWLLLLPHALACDRKKKTEEQGPLVSERGGEYNESHYE
jgi:hypothetical protein